MRVDVEGAGEDLVVVVSGEVDSMTAPGLRESLAEVLARPGAVRVVVDLAAVTFLDSAGLCALAAAHRDVRSTGRTLLLRAGDNRAVLRPLQITGLWDVLGHTAD
ncbi:hypothetical protein ASG41_22165 [Modestobacter sp. Leaf380]|nr:hypothetical protein ASG41_22165 [Modestobacter sp. Leaf380]